MHGIICSKKYLVIINIRLTWKEAEDKVVRKSTSGCAEPRERRSREEQQQARECRTSRPLAISRTITATHSEPSGRPWFHLCPSSWSPRKCTCRSPPRSRARYLKPRSQSRGWGGNASQAGSAFRSYTSQSWGSGRWWVRSWPRSVRSCPPSASRSLVGWGNGAWFSRKLPPWFLAFGTVNYHRGTEVSADYLGALSRTLDPSWLKGKGSRSGRIW